MWSTEMKEEPTIGHLKYSKIGTNMPYNFGINISDRANISSTHENKIHIGILRNSKQSHMPTLHCNV